MQFDDLDISETTLYHHAFREGDNGFFSFGYRYRKPGTYDLSKEDGNCYHLHILLKGAGFFTDEAGSVCPLSASFAFQRPPKKPCMLLVLPEAAYLEYDICIGGYAFCTLKAFGMILDQDAVFPLDLLPHQEKWMSHILADAITNHPEPSELFFNLQKLIQSLHQQNMLLKSRSEHFMVNSAKQILSSNYKKQISLEEVAAGFQISYERFRKIFKEAVGVSPLQFRLQCKFYYAENLLATGCSVSEAAAEIGYQDPFIFSRQFKKYMGHSPSFYKKRPKGAGVP